MSSKYPTAIVVDSAASLPADADWQGLLYVAPMYLVMEGRSYLDGVEVTAEELYRRLREGAEPPTTSAPSPATYLDAFRRAAEAARSVLCLTVSARYSSSHNSALNAADRARQELPGVEVRVLDSGSAAGGQGLVATEAWRAARSGANLDAVEAAARRVMGRVRLLAYLDTLYYLWKGGRVPKIAHAGAALLRIKPTFELLNGEVHTVAHPRTQARAMRRLLELVEERAGPGPMHATVMHTDDQDQALRLQEELRRRFRCVELFVSRFSPVMGAHTGPGLVGVAFWNE